MKIPVSIRWSSVRRSWGGKTGFQFQDGVEEVILHHEPYRFGVVESGEGGDPAVGQFPDLRDSPEKMQLPVPLVGAEGDIGDDVHGMIRAQTGAVRQQVASFFAGWSRFLGQKHRKLFETLCRFSKGALCQRRIYPCLRQNTKATRSDLAA